MNESDPWLKPHEVAHMLNFHINTVKRLIASGKLKGHRVCSRGDWRIPLSEVNAYLEKYK